MSDQESAKTEETQQPAPKAQKKVTITFVVDAEVNQNEFKNWVKSCPFSAEGDQTVIWENLAVAAPSAPSEVEAA